MGFLQKLFSPLGYIGAVILASLGLAPVNATQWLASHVSSEAISWVPSEKGRLAFLAAGVLIFVGMYRNHLARLEKQAEEAHKQRLPALSLPTTQVTDIAVYLRDRSAWGWRKRKELNIKNFVQDAVPDELRRAGCSGEVRYIGAPSDDTISQEINPGYWGTAEFDPAKIWDDRNWSFTVVRLGSAYILDKRFVRAPREDVMRTWPPASLALRLYVQSILWWRHVRRGLPASALDDPICARIPDKRLSNPPLA